MIDLRWLVCLSVSLGYGCSGAAETPSAAGGGAPGGAGVGGALTSAGESAGGLGSSGSGSNGGRSAVGGGGGQASNAGSSHGGASDAGTGGVSSTGGSGGTAGGGGGRSGGGGGGSGSGGAATVGDPPQKTLRVFWLRPSDVPFEQKYPDGIGKVVLEAQKFYKAELGKTFKVNDPIVETVIGDHVKSWYEDTPNGGDKYWWSVTNMQQELVRKFGLKSPDSRWMVVGEVSAEGDGAGGGGSPGWVILCQHDADGAAGIGGTINRWYGGMVHELGHAFGLPDASSTDGTPMSASLYDYPNTHFSDSQKNSILTGKQSSFLF